MNGKDLEIISEINRLNTETFRYSQIARQIFQKYGAQSPPQMAYYFRIVFDPDRFETHDFVPAFASWSLCGGDVSDDKFDYLINRVFQTIKSTN